MTAQFGSRFRLCRSLTTRPGQVGQWGAASDADPVQAETTRRQLVQRCLEPPTLLLGSHFAPTFPKREARGHDADTPRPAMSTPEQEAEPGRNGAAGDHSCQIPRMLPEFEGKAAR